MFCCTLKEHIGCVKHCETVHLGINATQTGTYFVETQLNGALVTYEKYFTIGDSLCFKNYFNENMLITFKLLQPDGTYYTSVTGVDCFEFTNIPNTTINLDQFGDPYC